MKSNYLLIALTSAAMLASCSSELDVPKTGDGDCTVMFTAQLPSGMSRAYGLGAQAKSLKYAVYEQGSKTPLKIYGDGTTEYGTAVFPENALTTTVTLQLAQGKSYDVVFWADAGGDAYTFDASSDGAGATIVANYGDATVANDESLDAFYAKESIEVTGSMTPTANLTRPFAQLNIGTSDYDAAVAAGYTVTKTAVKVSGVSNSFNLSTGEVFGESVDVVYNVADIPANDESFPVGSDTYKYLAMNYVLVGSGVTADVELSTYADGSATSVASSYTYVPLQANYRTNIYGALLTNPVAYNVEIMPAFASPDTNVEIWDGTSQSEPQYDETAQAYVVTGASEFASILANGGILSTAQSMRSRGDEDNVITNIKLTSDIDFGGHTLPLPDASIAEADIYKDFTLDGQGFTIKNFKTSSYGVNGGLFPKTNGTVVINNLNIDNATIGSTSVVNLKDQYAGVVIGRANGSVELNNVNVNNSKVYGKNKVGGLVGFLAQYYMYASNCKVQNTELYGLGTDGGCVGGIVGYNGTWTDQPGIKFTNCEVSNVKISAPDGGYNDDGTPHQRRGNGYLIGTLGCDRDIYLNNCSVTGNNIMESNFTVSEFIGSYDPRVSHHVYVDGVLTPSLTADLFINNIAGLKAFRDEVNSGTFKAKVTRVVADIDLNNEVWEPIGFGNNVYTGTFDGCNHTIKNLKIEMDGQNYAAFFGRVDNYSYQSSIKNFTLENVNVTGNTYVAAVVGECYVKPTIDNVHVINAKINGNHWVGGIAAYLNGNIINCSVVDSEITAVPLLSNGSYDNGDKVGGIFGYGDTPNYTDDYTDKASYLVDNNTVRNVTIKGYRDLGGIAGASYGSVSNCTVDGVTIIIDQKTNSYGEKTPNAGVFIGRVLGDAQSSGTSNNVNITTVE